MHAYHSLKESCSHLAAVISNQTVRHDSGETSGKHEAIIAKIDQHSSFAFFKSTAPGFLSFSHSANIRNSSTGTHMLSLGKVVSQPFSRVSEHDEELAFFFDCIPLKTVNI